jgi:hypothetical protein
MLFKCSSTTDWKAVVCIKWWRVNENIPYRKVWNCTNATERNNFGKYLFKSGCKCEIKSVRSGRYWRLQEVEYQMNKLLDVREKNVVVE